MTGVNKIKGHDLIVINAAEAKIANNTNQYGFTINLRTKYGIIYGNMLFLKTRQNIKTYL